MGLELDRYHWILIFILLISVILNIYYMIKLKNCLDVSIVLDMINKCNGKQPCKNNTRH